METIQVSEAVERPFELFHFGANLDEPCGLLQQILKIMIAILFKKLLISMKIMELLIEI